MTDVFASALISMEEIEPNLGSRVKFGGFLLDGICRRVSSPFLLFVMYTRRRHIPSVAKRTDDLPTMNNPRLPVFALTLSVGDRRLHMRLEQAGKNSNVGDHSGRGA